MSVCPWALLSLLWAPPPLIKLTKETPSCLLVSVRVANSWRERVRLNPILPRLCLSLSIWLPCFSPTSPLYPPPHVKSMKDFLDGEFEAVLQTLSAPTRHRQNGGESDRLLDPWPLQQSYKGIFPAGALHSVCSLYFFLHNCWLRSNSSSLGTVNVNTWRQARSDTRSVGDADRVVCVVLKWICVRVLGCNHLEKCTNCKTEWRWEPFSSVVAQARAYLTLPPHLKLRWRSAARRFGLFFWSMKLQNVTPVTSPML